MLLATTLVSAKGSLRGPVDHLYLYEKTSVEGHAWTVVDHGSWGKMTMLFHKLFFVFNGHKLVANVSYTLISYREPGAAWPATNCTILGTGTANAGGNVHIMGLMPPLVINSYPTESSDEYSGNGSKIWLVLSSDMNGTTLQGWNPAEYLFEGKLII